MYFVIQRIREFPLYAVCNFLINDVVTNLDNKSNALFVLVMKPTTRTLLRKSYFRQNKWLYSPSYSLIHSLQQLKVKHLPPSPSSYFLYYFFFLSSSSRPWRVNQNMFITSLSKLEINPSLEDLSGFIQILNGESKS